MKVDTFAWVEPKDGGKYEDGKTPYYNLLVSGIVMTEGDLEDELQEMADILNSRVRVLIEALEDCQTFIKYYHGDTTTIYGVIDDALKDFNGR